MQGLTEAVLNLKTASSGFFRGANFWIEKQKIFDNQTRVDISVEEEKTLVELAESFGDLFWTKIGRQRGFFSQNFSPGKQLFLAEGDGLVAIRRLPFGNFYPLPYSRLEDGINDCQLVVDFFLVDFDFWF